MPANEVYNSQKPANNRAFPIIDIFEPSSRCIFSNRKGKYHENKSNISFVHRSVFNPVV